MSHRELERDVVIALNRIAVDQGDLQLRLQKQYRCFSIHSELRGYYTIQIIAMRRDEEISIGTIGWRGYLVLADYKRKFTDKVRLMMQRLNDELKDSFITLTLMENTYDSEIY